MPRAYKVLRDDSGAVVAATLGHGDFAQRLHNHAHACGVRSPRYTLDTTTTRPLLIFAADETTRAAILADRA